MPLVLFYTCANAKYEHFVPLYLLSNLLAVPDSIAEVGLEDKERFTQENESFLAALRRVVGDRFSLQTVQWSNESGPILPHVVRFITEPSTKADYVYIGDVDIIMLDGKFPSEHLEFMERVGLPYANSVRENTRGSGRQRTTGLHFTKWDAYYPIPDLDGLDLRRENDEVNLSWIIERKGLRLQEAEWWRPVPGIHASPNRTPTGGDGKLSWSLGGWKSQYKRFRDSAEFNEIEPFLPEPSREIIRQIDEHQ